MEERDGFVIFGGGKLGPCRTDGEGRTNPQERKKYGNAAASPSFVFYGVRK